ncbi:extracellular solute-binding protein [Pseudomonas sp. OHS18]|uniref:extracellular solute-binding protein n=1 Tax=Pseudomonas sp. OHS18 TaxID=3399679 RepID=UPI003A884C89
MNIFTGNAVSGITLAMLASIASHAFAEDITFVSQGGAYQEAQTKAILEPAAKKLGLTLKQDSSPKAYPIIKTQVQSGKVTWDVVDLPTGDCIRGVEEGLFEKLDLALIPNAAQLPAELKDDYSVGYISYSTVLAYRTDAFDEDSAPKTWADFWDTKSTQGNARFVTCRGRPWKLPCSPTVCQLTSCTPWMSSGPSGSSKRSSLRSPPGGLPAASRRS